MPDPIGYFGLILPDFGEAGEFTGGFVFPASDDDHDVRKMLSLASELGDHAAGNLSAVMVEGATTGRPDVLATAVKAFAKLTGNNWFYIVAHMDDGGIFTDVRTFDARTIDEARDELMDVPEVYEIREAIAKLGGTRN